MWLWPMHGQKNIVALRLSCRHVLNVEEASQASKLEIAIQIDPHVHACT
jgi:hypothetical protein